MSEGKSSTLQMPIEERRRLAEPGEGRPRAVGSPLPVGSGAAAPITQSAAASQERPVEKLRSFIPTPVPIPAAKPPAPVAVASRPVPAAVATAAPAPPPSAPPALVPPPPAPAAAAPPRAPAPPLPALPSPAKSQSSGPTGLQRAMSALKATLPLVQRILPLLDGNIGTAVANVLAPQHHAPPAPPPPSPVNLTPIKESLASLETRHRELSDQLVEQNSSLKRVEDQLGMVREATDRNTLEQQELMDDLKGVGRKVSLFAYIALALLLVSVAINVVLFLHIFRVLP